MKLKDNGIVDLDTWKIKAPPKKKEAHWVKGRSAMEFARYMTAFYPAVPKELEDFLLNFTDISAEFDWRVEHVTHFSQYNLGIGEGRNHDAFMFNSDVVVGIEAKVDEPLGSQIIGEALKTASENKRNRINGMIHMLFGDGPEKHKSLRYQLVTASTAMLLEAKSEKHNVPNAVLLVIVFKTKKACEKKMQKNNNDIENFLNEISAVPCGDYYSIPTYYGSQNGINLYFKIIEICLD